MSRPVRVILCNIMKLGKYGLVSRWFWPSAVILLASTPRFSKQDDS